MYKVSIGNAFGHSIYNDLTAAEITEGVTNAYDKIDRIFTEYKVSLLSPENMEADLFGEATTAQPQNQGFVASLGAAIRVLITSFGKMIERIGEMFMSNDAKIRKQQQQLERELAANPDLKRKVMALSASGVINLKDIKDINELSKEVDKLMEEKDPKTLRGKLEKLKKEWDDPNGKFLKRVAAIGATVGLVATIYKATTSLRGFKDDITNGSKHNKDTMGKLVEGLRSQISEDEMNKGVAVPKDVLDKKVSKKLDDVTLWEAKLAAKKFEHGCYQQSLQIMNHNYSELNKGQQFIARFFGNSKGKTVKNAPLKRALDNVNAQAKFFPKADKPDKGETK